MSEADSNSIARSPELVFALVRAIGTAVSDVMDALEASLSDAGLEVVPIRLSDQFHKVSFLSELLRSAPEDERYRSFMDVGDLLRSALQRSDAVAVLGIKEIVARRSSLPKGRGRVFVFRSLMHPDEVTTLRRVYGPRLFVLSAFAPEDIRERQLARKIAESRAQPEAAWRPTAVNLL
ncbi:MAG: hypothetical protein OXH63_15805, partial [Gemmatimonadetes bacterium]|nr:hypothetical protein [Gemmatimonadota bacterium]